MGKKFYSHLFLAMILLNGSQSVYATAGKPKNWIGFLTNKSTQATKCEPTPAKEPPAKTEKPKDYPLKLKASFIYWQPIQTYMDIAYEGSDAELNSLSGFNFLNGRMIYFDHCFEPGFQLGAAYRFNNRWDLLADYTFLHATEKRSASLPKMDFCIRAGFRSI